MPFGFCSRTLYNGENFSPLSLLFFSFLRQRGKGETATKCFLSFLSPCSCMARDPPKCCMGYSNRMLPTFQDVYSDTNWLDVDVGCFIFYKKNLNPALLTPLPHSMLNCCGCIVGGGRGASAAVVRMRERGYTVLQQERREN